MGYIWCHCKQRDAHNSVLITCATCQGDVLVCTVHQVNGAWQHFTEITVSLSTVNHVQTDLEGTEQ